MERGKVVKRKVDSEIKVVANWQHTKEATVAFRRLMALLLQQKMEPKAKEEGKQ